MAGGTPSILCLPDELLEAIVSHLPSASDIVAFGRTSQHLHKVTCAPHLWRPHCVRTWQFWEVRHNLEEKLKLPPGKIDWQQLYSERAGIDSELLSLFNAMLSTQKCRNFRMEQIAAHRYDVKDLLFRLKNRTPDEAEDVLARRYYAKATLGRMQRGIAVETWMRLQQRQPVKLEEALGAFDLFVLTGDVGDLRDIRGELDRIAHCIKDKYKEESKHADVDFDRLTIRQKAVRVAEYLRSESLVGKPDAPEYRYHSLRNNFIGFSLFNPIHSSLPLQSVAIYCAVAERLGIDASPSNYPRHVYAVIQAPADQTLDGEPRVSPSTTNTHTDTVIDDDTNIMYMDPWSTSIEVPQYALRQFLIQRVGISPGEHAHLLGPSTALDMVLRTCRNIATSTEGQFELDGSQSSDSGPDVSAARYAMLWAITVLRGNEGDAELAGDDRRRFLSHMLDHFGAQFSRDVGILASGIGEGCALFPDEPDRSTYSDLVTRERAADRAGKHPRPRDTEAKDAVKYAVGQYFRHRKYGYAGFVIGWDRSCSAAPSWIDQMGVLDLPGGAEQPFYHVIAEDKSDRYVAQENIDVRQEAVSDELPETLMELAGRYFKRWDNKKRVFVSNIKDEYPDD